MHSSRPRLILPHLCEGRPHHPGRLQHRGDRAELWLIRLHLRADGAAGRLSCRGCLHAAMPDQAALKHPRPLHNGLYPSSTTNGKMDGENTEEYTLDHFLLPPKHTGNNMTLTTSNTARNHSSNRSSRSLLSRTSGPRNPVYASTLLSSTWPTFPPG